MTLNVNSGTIPTDGSSLELVVPPGELLIDAYCEMPDKTIHRSTDGVLTLKYTRNENGKVITVNFATSIVFESADIVAYLVSTPRG